MNGGSGLKSGREDGEEEVEKIDLDKEEEAERERQLEADITVSIRTVMYRITVHASSNGTRIALLGQIFVLPHPSMGQCVWIYRSNFLPVPRPVRLPSCPMPLQCLKVVVVEQLMVMMVLLPVV